MRDTRSVDEDARGGLGAILRTRIELWLVVVFMALSFGAGVLVTALGQEEPAPAPVVGIQGPAQMPLAPPLTDEQIRQGLPSGHPDISGATGATGADDREAEQATGDGGNP